MSTEIRAIEQHPAKLHGIIPMLLNDLKSRLVNTYIWSSKSHPEVVVTVKKEVRLRMQRVESGFATFKIDTIGDDGKWKVRAVSAIDGLLAGGNAMLIIPNDEYLATYDSVKARGLLKLSADTDPPAKGSSFTLAPLHHESVQIHITELVNIRIAHDENGLSIGVFKSGSFGGNCSEMACYIVD